MSVAPSLPGLHSPFLCCPLKHSTSSSLCVSHKFARNQRSPPSYPCIRALDLDQNTIVAISVGLVSVAVGIGIPVFYETQIDSARNADFAWELVLLRWSLVGMRKKYLDASIVMVLVRSHAPHVKVLEFSLGTLIVGNSKTMTEDSY